VQPNLLIFDEANERKKIMQGDQNQVNTLSKTAKAA
jgi:hypothetical protein